MAEGALEFHLAENVLLPDNLCPGNIGPGVRVSDFLGGSLGTGPAFVGDEDRVKASLRVSQYLPEELTP